MSNLPVPSTSGAAYTWDSTKRASIPAARASSRASARAGVDISTPVTDAPSRPSDTVSVPMWHCR